MKLFFCTIGSLLLAASLSPAEPQIRQIFPVQHFLLGQSRYWNVEVRHPIWESYTLKANEIQGVQIAITESNSRIEGDEVVTTHRLQITPDELVIPDTPSLLLTDKKGQTTVLNGEPLLVRSISGDSLTLQEPLHPGPPAGKSRVASIAYSLALVLLTAGLAFSIWKRKRANRPRQVLIRQMKRILREITLTPNKYPAALEKIFRSEYFWGDRAEARTATELLEAAGSDPDLTQIAETLGYLEQFRYSDTGAFEPDDRIRRSVTIGLEMLQQDRSRPVVRHP